MKGYARPLFFIVGCVVVVTPTQPMQNFFKGFWYILLTMWLTCGKIVVLSKKIDGYFLKGMAYCVVPYFFFIGKCATIT